MCLVRNKLNRGNILNTRVLFAWLVHLLTASGAVFGLLSAYLIVLHHFIPAFWLMVVTITIDAFDGYLARAIRIKEVLPHVDGALLDNIVDFFTSNRVLFFAYKMNQVR